MIQEASCKKSKLTSSQYITGDLGGTAKTYEYTNAVMKALN